VSDSIESVKCEPIWSGYMILDYLECSQTFNAHSRCAHVEHNFPVSTLLILSVHFIYQSWCCPSRSLQSFFYALLLPIAGHTTTIPLLRTSAGVWVGVLCCCRAAARAVYLGSTGRSLGKCELVFSVTGVQRGQYHVTTSAVTRIIKTTLCFSRSNFDLIYFGTGGRV
jgi:hypothetical protein